MALTSFVILASTSRVGQDDAAQNTLYMHLFSLSDKLNLKNNTLCVLPLPNTGGVLLLLKNPVQVDIIQHLLGNQAILNQFLFVEPNLDFPLGIIRVIRTMDQIANRSFIQT